MHVDRGHTYPGLRVLEFQVSHLVLSFSKPHVSKLAMMQNIDETYLLPLERAEATCLMSSSVSGSLSDSYKVVRIASTSYLGMLSCVILVDLRTDMMVVYSVRYKERS